MRRLLVVLAALVAVAALPAVGSAHPLGNFTVNRFSDVQLSGNRVYVLYVLDMAEIPTFQARQDGVDPAAYARRLARNAHLEIGGRPVALTPVRHALAFPKGQGGLHTMRLEVVLQGPVLRGGETIAYRDGNYADRIGWKEIVVSGSHGASIRAASVPATSISHDLRAYPKGQLHSPLDVTSATATLEPGSSEGPAPTLGGGPSLQAPDRVADSGFSSLVARKKLSTGVILLSLLIAAFWGAAHALTPGHGKALIAGYLVGTKGKPRHAVMLGATVTITHTAGVFALGLITLALSQFIVPETLYPWLTLVSGLLVVGVGITVLRARIRTGSWSGAHGHSHGPDGHHHHHHDHHHDHDHDHHHDDHEHHHQEHEHEHDEALTHKGILGVGVAAGILPCPSALVVLLSAIALHRVGFGLALIVAFSLGLACTVTGIGLAAVLARRAFSRVSLEGRVVRALPAVSAFVIVCVGAVITARAIPHVL
jgi:nickel/cobalt transporter (NicO) family protein